MSHHFADGTISGPALLGYTLGQLGRIWDRTCDMIPITPLQLLFVKRLCMLEITSPFQYVMPVI